MTSCKLCEATSLKHSRALSSTGNASCQGLGTRPRAYVAYVHHHGRQRINSRQCSHCYIMDDNGRSETANSYCFKNAFRGSDGEGQFTSGKRPNVKQGEAAV